MKNQTESKLTGQKRIKRRKVSYPPVVIEELDGYYSLPPYAVTRRYNPETERFEEVVPPPVRQEAKE